MPLTRREFSAMAAGGIALTVLGQAPQPLAGRDDPKKKANLATEPFLIGPIERYKSKGLYPDYKSAKGVWIVSDGQSLVVFSATCTHLGCTTNWVENDKHFQCPCHESRFDLEGTNTKGKAKRPLERCALRITKGPDGEPQIEVDPTRRFRKDKGEWSDPASSLSLA